MAIEYEFKPERKCVHCKATGLISLSEIVNYIDQMIQDPQLKQPFMEIVDFDKEVSFDFGYNETSVLISTLKRLELKNHYQGTILVAGSALMRGMSNIFKVVGEGRKINIKVVTKLEAAYDAVDKHFASIESI